LNHNPGNHIDSLKSNFNPHLGGEEDSNTDYVECVDYEDTIMGTKRIFKCLHADCGKTFRFRSEVVRHLTTHSDKKSYTCGFPGCHKSFKRADALRHHSRTHSDTTPFACDFPGCDSRFTSKAALNYHTLKHGEKSFVCSYPGCNKSFATQSQVRQHERASLYHQRMGNKTSSTDGNQEEEADEVEFLDRSPSSFKETNQSQVNINPSPQPQIDNNIIAVSEDSLSPEQINSLGSALAKRGKEKDLLILDMVTKIFEENQILQKKLQETERLMDSITPKQNPEDEEFVKKTWKLRPEGMKEIIFDYLFNSNEAAILKYDNS